MNDVLLVDDEKYVLDSLCCALDWAEYGFKNVHTSSSASEAMDVLREHQIDLLISDIMMPGMTGLEMFETVRAHYPSTHCVLISAHGKFEYAQKALKMGVENYLLKPIDINELRETVYRTAENIAHTVEITQSLYENNILERWLYGRISANELVEHSQYTKFNVLLRFYRVLILRINKDKDMEHSIHRSITKMSIDLSVYELKPNAETYILLIGGRDLCDEVMRVNTSGLAALCGGGLVVCGSLAASSSEVARSLADADNTLAYARLANMKGYVSFDDVDWGVLPGEHAAELGDILQSDSPELRARKWIIALSSAYAEDSVWLRAVYAQICLALPQTVNNTFAIGKSPIFAAFTPPYTTERLENLVAAAVNDMSIYAKQSERGFSPITKRVVKYISENLNGSLSIKQFCEQTKMNANYIGRLFKDETCMYFSDYVSLMRINKAKTLLETTSHSIGSIARQVGIYDVSYFAQCFKKQERLSPMKYRQLFQKSLTVVNDGNNNS
jgi:two-component system response regulator YesN